MLFLSFHPSFLLQSHRLFLSLFHFHFRFLCPVRFWLVFRHMPAIIFSSSFIRPVLLLLCISHCYLFCYVNHRRQQEIVVLSNNKTRELPVPVSQNTFSFNNFSVSFHYTLHNNGSSQIQQGLFVFF